MVLGFKLVITIYVKNLKQNWKQAKVEESRVQPKTRTSSLQNNWSDPNQI